MKTLLKLWVALLLLTPLAGTQLLAQDENRPDFVVMTTAHWNMDLAEGEGSPEEWRALEQEYLEKVTKKNEHIMGTAVLRHLYTADNTEAIFVATYKTWADIEQAQARNTELEKAAWPDDVARRAFMDKQGKYYTATHSDEIYATLPGAKLPSAQVDTSRVIYIQKVYRAYPKDAKNSEFQAMRMEYAEKVIQKNPYLLAYYPLAHAWGACSNEMLNVYVVASMADVPKLNQAWTGLEEAAWPDKAARDAWFKKYDTYFTGVHGDYIYSTIPGVSK